MKERIVQGAVSSDHIVQLFDSVESLVQNVATFVSQGLCQNAAVLVVAKPTHWAAITRRFNTMPNSGRPAGTSANQLTVLNAEETLATFMRDGRPDPALFQRSVGKLVRSLATPGTILHIYGEMVELLAEEGNFWAARRLEELWNELAARYSFTLLCGYSAAHFTTPAARAALAGICDAHTHVQRGAMDSLAEWLIASERPRGDGPVEGQPAPAHPML
jgi:hypothetical protein